jgi:hypothetical protein
MGLRLVPDLPIFANDEPEVPFDVIVTNPSHRHPNVTYAEVMSFSFIVDGSYPHGAVIMLLSDASVAEHICQPGDTIENTSTGVSVEAVDA